MNANLTHALASARAAELRAIADGGHGAGRQAVAGRLRRRRAPGRRRRAGRRLGLRLRAA